MASHPNQHNSPKVRKKARLHLLPFKRWDIVAIWCHGYRPEDLSNNHHSNRFHHFIIVRWSNWKSPTETLSCQVSISRIPYCVSYSAKHAEKTVCRFSEYWATEVSCGYWHNFFAQHLNQTQHSLGIGGYEVLVVVVGILITYMYWAYLADLHTIGTLHSCCWLLGKIGLSQNNILWMESTILDAGISLFSLWFWTFGIIHIVRYFCLGWTKIYSQGFTTDWLPSVFATCWSESCDTQWEPLWESQLFLFL